MTSMFNEARMGDAVNTTGAQELVEENFDSVNRNPGALISLARLKTANDYTYTQSMAVVRLMIALSKQTRIEIMSRRARQALPICCTILARP